MLNTYVKLVLLVVAVLVILAVLLLRRQSALIGRQA